MVEGMKIKVTSFKRPHICTIALSAQPCSRPPPTYVSTRDSWTPMGRSGPASCAGSWCTQGSVGALQESISRVMCMFWWLCGGVNGNLLQEGFCHTQVYCTQSPRPCGRPLLTHTSAQDTQTQLCLSPRGLWVLVHTRFV